MKTVKPIIHWGDLFSQNGTPLSGFQTVINGNRIPLIEHGDIKDSITASKTSILFWNGATPEKVHSPIANIHNLLDIKVKKVNGSINQYNFAGVQLPERNDDIITKQLQLYFKREKRCDPFGELLWKEFQERNFDIHYLGSRLMNISFKPVYVKDPDSGKVTQLDDNFPVRREDTGIYFVMEHDPNTSYNEIVYVGKSFTSMRTTIWCHFHDWNGKYSYQRPRGSRGEDRGRWIEKIQEGYTYSIGTIKVLPDQSGFPGIQKHQILDLEGKFIQLLSPRDNIKDKLYLDENQVELFNSKLVEESQESVANQEGSPDDDVPF